MGFLSPYGIWLVSFSVDACVVVPSIYSGRQSTPPFGMVGASAGSHRRKVIHMPLFSPRSFCGARSKLYRACSRPFPSSTLESNLLYSRNNHFPLLGIMWEGIPGRVTSPRFDFTT